MWASCSPFESKIWRHARGFTPNPNCRTLCLPIPRIDHILTFFSFPFFLLVRYDREANSFVLSCKTYKKKSERKTQTSSRVFSFRSCFAKPSWRQFSATRTHSIATVTIFFGVYARPLLSYLKQVFRWNAPSYLSFPVGVTVQEGTKVRADEDKNPLYNSWHFRPYSFHLKNDSFVNHGAGRLLKSTEKRSTRALKQQRRAQGCWKTFTCCLFAEVANKKKCWSWVCFKVLFCFPYPLA